jgi:myo-inositol-1(or 4)-monophosphatase
LNTQKEWALQRRMRVPGWYAIGSAIYLRFTKKAPSICLPKRIPNPFNLLTEADTESEKKIITTIREAFPDHAILAEESGASEGAREYRWLIDPLDGTTNFAHQLPMFAISIALTTETEIVLGLVLNPMDGELFSAISGQGAELNGKPIKVSSTQSVCESLLVTGFPYNFSEISEPLMRRLSL